MYALLRIEAIAYNYIREIQNMPFGLGTGFKKSWWVAEILGADTRWGMRRSFLHGKTDYSLANSKLSRGVYMEYLLKHGRAYEVSEPTSWGCVERYFCTANSAGDVVKITKQEALRIASVNDFIRIKNG